MLERAVSDVPNEASGGSVHSQTVSHSIAKSIHSDTIAEPNDGTMKKSPLILALSKFTTVIP